MIKILHIRSATKEIEDHVRNLLEGELSQRGLYFPKDVLFVYSYVLKHGRGKRVNEVEFELLDLKSGQIEKRGHELIINVGKKNREEKPCQFCGSTSVCDCSIECANVVEPNCCPKCRRVISQAMQLCEVGSSSSEEEEDDEYQPDEECMSNFGFAFSCHDCGKTIDVNSDVYLFSRPNIFRKRFRCRRCGLSHQHFDRAEFWEKWRNR